VTTTPEPADPAGPADLSIGAFSDDPPWLVDPGAMPWRRHLDLVRGATHRQVPELIEPSRLPPAGRMARVVRHLGLASGRWAVGARRQGGSASKSDLSRRLRIAAERLGPTYIKLGQIISSGRGLFPDELVDEFEKCRDQVSPEPFWIVREVVEGDIGDPIEATFERFDREPIAAASIAQVHGARLRTGEEVVVKVQRPSVDALVHDDLRVMAWLAPHFVGRIPITALANPPALVELFAETIVEELDFRLEAENMLDVARSLAELDERRYVVPRPHPHLVTRRVLVMERLSGFAYDDLESMVAAGIDTHDVLRTGMVGFMEGAMFHGVFHGDLHGGNLLVQPDGRTALLDFGITGRLSEPRRQAFLRLLVSGSVNDVRGQLAALRDLGALPADTDLDEMIVELELDRPVVDPTSLEAHELVEELQRVLKALLGYGARMPKELMLFVKNMVFLDSAIANLAPDIDLLAEVAEIATYFAATHGERIAAETGMRIDVDWEMDTDKMKASWGLDDSIDRLSYRDLQARRDLIRSRLSGRRG
jgi:ubiquinone biosynthesis protein